MAETMQVKKQKMKALVQNSSLSFISSVTRKSYLTSWSLFSQQERGCKNSTLSHKVVMRSYDTIYVKYTQKNSIKPSYHHHPPKVNKMQSDLC